MTHANVYLTASSTQNGALGIFHAYGEEEVLARILDACVGRKTTPAPAEGLAPQELRYGWLRDGSDSSEPIDEVMLAAPASGQRVLMTHGGRVIREQAERYFERCGFSAISLNDNKVKSISEPLLDTLLASCVTEGQAAAVLAAREHGDVNPADLDRVFVQHRVVLAGAPNAGKSSLLNALAGYDRAFVDPEAGATRDVVDELVDLGGYAVWVGDMPGFMGVGGSAGEIEAEAWRRAEQRLRLAEAVWFVVDGSEEWGAAADAAASAVAGILDGAGGASVLVVVNKTDRPVRLAGEPWRKYFPSAAAVFVNTLPEGNAAEALERAAPLFHAWSVS